MRNSLLKRVLQHFCRITNWWFEKNAPFSKNVQCPSIPCKDIYAYIRTMLHSIIIETNYFRAKEVFWTLCCMKRLFCAPILHRNCLIIRNLSHLFVDSNEMKSTDHFAIITRRHRNNALFSIDKSVFCVTKIRIPNQESCDWIIESANVFSFHFHLLNSVKMKSKYYYGILSKRNEKRTAISCIDLVMRHCVVSWGYSGQNSMRVCTA